LEKRKKKNTGGRKTNWGMKGQRDEIKGARDTIANSG